MQHPFDRHFRHHPLDPFDPHFAHQMVWRDFDRGVAQTLRRQRRARLLSALGFGRGRMPGGPSTTAQPAPYTGRVPRQRADASALRRVGR